MIDNPNLYDIDAEKAILGAVLVDNSCIFDIRNELKPTDFYEHTHSLIWSIFLDKADHKYPIDLISVNDEIKTRNYGIDFLYLSDIASSNFASANVSYYVRIVKDKSIMRVTWRINTQCASEIVDGGKAGIDIANDLAQKAGDLAAGSVIGNYCKMAEVLPKTIKTLEFHVSNPDSLMGITSGFKSIDNITGGIREDDYVVIGARASTGKTSFAMTMMNNIAIDNGEPVGFFSCEMSKESVNERQVYSLSGVSKKRLKLGHLSASHMNNIQEACTKIRDAPMFIDDTPNITLSAFRASARKMVRQEGVKIIFVDYIGLINSEKPRLARWEQIGYVSKQLKQFCRETHVPMIALSQLGRDAQGKKPTMADLRDSGQIEEDADTIFLLHRPKEPEINAEIIETELICAKQRNGPVGTIKLNFIPSLIKFEDADTD